MTKQYNNQTASASSDKRFILHLSSISGHIDYLINNMIDDEGHPEWNVIGKIAQQMNYRDIINADPRLKGKIEKEAERIIVNGLVLEGIGIEEASLGVWNIWETKDSNPSEIWAFKINVGTTEKIKKVIDNGEYFKKFEGAKEDADTGELIDEYYLYPEDEVVKMSIDITEEEIGRAVKKAIINKHNEENPENYIHDKDKAIKLSDLEKTGYMNIEYETGIVSFNGWGEESIEDVIIALDLL